MCCSNARAETTTTTTIAPQPTRPTTARPTTRGTSVTANTPPPFDVNKLCLSPEGVPGDCRNIRDCPILLQRLQAEGSSEEFVSYVQHSNVICAGRSEEICCLDENLANMDALAVLLPEPKPRLLAIEDGCGFSNTSSKRVVGGEPAPKGDHTRKCSLFIYLFIAFN